MSKMSILAPCTIYGVAWAICTNHPYWGFITLLLGGFLFGIIFGFEGFVTNTIIAALVATIMAFIALIPGLGELADGIVLLAVLLIKLRTIFKNFWLILIGFVCYLSLFQLPHEIHHQLSQGSSNGGYKVIDFLIGAGIMAGIFYILEAIGYHRKRIYIFIIGLPGFLFLFNYGKDIIDGFNES